MRRAIAVVLTVSYLGLPLGAAAREFDFSRPTAPAKAAPKLNTPGETRIIPPPPRLAPRTTVRPTTPAATPVSRPAANPASPVPKFDVITTQNDLPKGTQVTATVLRELTYSPSDALAMTLEISDDVRDNGGDVVIPKGSTVWGSFQPVMKAEAEEEPATARREPRDRSKFPEGSRFIAERVSIGDRIYTVKAQTELLPTQADPRRDVGAEAGNGALIGAAGGAIITLLTGGLGLIPILATGALGATVGAVSASNPVVVVKPDTPLVLTLVEPLRVR